MVMLSAFSGISCPPSLVFSEVVIVFEDRDTLYVGFFRCTLSRVARNMYEAKPFRFVFCLEVLDGDLEVEMACRCGRYQGKAGIPSLFTGHRLRYSSDAWSIGNTTRGLSWVLRGSPCSLSGGNEIISYRADLKLKSFLFG